MDSKKIKKLLHLSLSELIAMADKVRAAHVSPKVELCTILNAKSGACAEDCKFCAQSSHHVTCAPAYPLKSTEEMLAAAQRAKDIGAERFDIVTSGNRLKPAEFEQILSAIALIRKTIGIAMCASLGSMDEEGFRLLREAGLSRYHHNLETSPRFFPRIVTTHTFQDRVRTIRAAKKCGFEVCSGGILGLGETMEDRMDMALWLKELAVDSVPLNMLVPIAGTSLADQPRLSAQEAIRTIALFRILLPDKIIKLAAGRESVLKDFQAMAFMAGANGMLIGGYLTINGRSPQEDMDFVRQIEALWKR